MRVFQAENGHTMTADNDIQASAMINAGLKEVEVPVLEKKKEPVRRKKS
jgi:hypothetical protein